METLMSNMWIVAAIMLVGLVLLVKSADWLVDGASALAKRFGISDLVIGLTVVAFGTSMPEFVVNMVSVADGVTDLALTNILGSNIINTYVILGVTALIYPIATQKRTRDFDLPLGIIAGLAVIMISVISPKLGMPDGINRWGGVVLLVIFVIFMHLTMRHAKDHTDELETSTYASMPLWRAIILILVGLIGLVVGGGMIVKSAVKIAVQLGVSDAIIGLTIVALGTSLPELATSAVAAFKKNSDIAIGNVAGSNIFNVFFVLGMSATIRPLPDYDNMMLDSVMVALGSMLVWLFVKISHKRELNRWGGVLLLIVYGAYLAYRLTHV